MLTDLIPMQKSRIDVVRSLYKFHTTVDVLRLDEIHPLVSGNKWFKLKTYLKEAQRLNKKTIVTFGGAFSNHILATAALSQMTGLHSIGIIRGEESTVLSPTLTDALSFGMQLFFSSREDYKNEKVPQSIFNFYYPEELYFIPEGGYGFCGVEGAKEILKEVDTSGYTHVVAAVGTGTMVAGLAAGCTPNQQVIGISILKNNLSVQKAIETLLPADKHHQFNLLHTYHFGGYAKYSNDLIRFMNEWHQHTGIPSDFVYTGKLFFAVNDLIEKNYFSEATKLLIIHSGGLQGNRSLPKGTLIF